MTSVLLIFLSILIGCSGIPKKKETSPIVAVIDTGFDVEHPALDHTLVDQYDYSNNSGNVSPYISRSKNEGLGYERSQDLVNLNPNLKSWLPSDRNLEEEFKSAAYHGTAIASLAIYDLPVQLALYKVYPIPKGEDPDLWMTESVAAAIKRAVSIGARIINISIGFTYKMDSPNLDDHHKFASIIKRIISQNSDVLFIAAAGNENQNIDGIKVAGYPCGLPLENIICVGAVDENKGLWKVSKNKGSNQVSFPGTQILYSFGSNVPTAVPLEMCVNKEIIKALFSKTNPTIQAAKNLELACNKNPGHALGEATSVATPLVTHRAAELLVADPTADTALLSKRLIESAVSSKTSPKLKVIVPKRPSWAAKWF